MSKTLLVDMSKRFYDFSADKEDVSASKSSETFATLGKKPSCSTALALRRVTVLEFPSLHQLLHCDTALILI